jgi:hypothetical protein
MRRIIEKHAICTIYAFRWSQHYNSRITYTFS